MIYIFELLCSTKKRVCQTMKKIGQFKRWQILFRPKNIVIKL